MTGSIGVLRSAAVVCGALVLAGCGLFGRNVDMGMSEAMKQKCPPVGIVAHTGQLTRFAGSGRETGDVAFRAALTDLKVVCTSPKDGGAVNARITFDILVEPGPAASAGSATLQYFVALTGDGKTVLRKDVYDSAHSLAAGPSRSRETLEATVPVKGDEMTYEEILIGLQLSRDELGYNLARSAGR
jgi:hypothetical protein